MDTGRGFLRTVELLPEISWWIYDRRGYGRSAGDGTTDFEGHVADLAVVLEHVGAVEGSTPVLMGHSLGGAIALALTQRRPDLVAALATFEAPAPWAEWWTMPHPFAEPRDPAREAEGFLRRMLGDDRWEALTPETRERKLRDGVAWVTELDSAAVWKGLEPAALEVPLVLGCGDASHISLQHARLIDEVMASSPHGVRVVIEGAPHTAHLTHPAEIADVVRLAIRSA
jgi:pimeloyl-ACP methyl ester carboxylesterase